MTPNECIHARAVSTVESPFSTDSETIVEYRRRTRAAYNRPSLRRFLRLRTGKET